MQQSPEESPATRGRQQGMLGSLSQSAAKRYFPPALAGAGTPVAGQSHKSLDCSCAKALSVRHKLRDAEVHCCVHRLVHQASPPVPHALRPSLSAAVVAAEADKGLSL